METRSGRVSADLIHSSSRGKFGGMSSEDRNERDRREPSATDVARLLAFELHRLHQGFDAQDTETLAGLVKQSESTTKRLEKVARALAALDKKNP